MSAESEQLRTARAFDLACQHRDVAAATRRAVKMHRHIRAGEPVDLSRVRTMVRFYAAEIHGWEIPA